MKKSIISGAMLLALAASNVSANTLSISMTDENFETKICYVAATEGLDAARELVSDKGLSFRKFEKSVTCNNKDLTTFAKQFKTAQLRGSETPKVQLVATNNDVESKICLESLTHGIDKTAAKYKINKDYIRCNGKPLPRFVNENKRRGVSVASVPE